MKTNFQKVWSVTWKTLTGIVLLMCVLGGGLMLMAYFDSWEFRHRYGSQSVEKIHAANSSTFLIECKYNRYYRTIDATTGKALTPKLSYIHNSPVSDTLSVFVDKKGKRGYIDAYTGKIAIPAQFEHAWSFSEGLGAVVKNNKLGFIDHQGNWVIEPCFRYAGENLDYVFRNGLCAVKNCNGLFGLIDKQGNFVLQPEYTIIHRTQNNCRLVEKDDLAGLFCDTTLQFVLDCEYDRIRFCHEGLTLTKDGRKWMVAHDDMKTVIFPFLFDAQHTFTVELDEYDEYGNHKSYEYQPIGYYSVGLLDGLFDRKTGLPITPAIYWRITMVTPNLFDCELSDKYNSEHIFINAKGERIQK